MKPETVEIQSWRYKTIVVIKRQQQTTISHKHLISYAVVFFQSFIARLFSSMTERCP